MAHVTTLLSSVVTMTGDMTTDQIPTCGGHSVENGKYFPTIDSRDSQPALGAEKILNIENIIDVSNDNKI